MDKELIDNPIHTRKFKLEALQIHQLILDNTIEIYGQQLEKQTQNLLNLINNLFKAENHFIRLVDQAENEQSKTELQAQIQNLEQEQADIDSFISQNENIFSLLGWAVKLFIK